MCTYLPTRQVLFTMIRACIGVEKPEALWFNQGIEKMEEEERQHRLSRAKELISKNKKFVGTVQTINSLIRTSIIHQKTIREK